MLDEVIIIDDSDGIIAISDTDDEVECIGSIGIIQQVKRTMLIKDKRALEVELFSPEKQELEVLYPEMKISACFSLLEKPVEELSPPVLEIKQECLLVGDEIKQECLFVGDEINGKDVGGAKNCRSLFERLVSEASEPCEVTTNGTMSPSSNADDEASLHYSENADLNDDYPNVFEKLKRGYGEMLSDDTEPNEGSSSDPERSVKRQRHFLDSLDSVADLPHDLTLRDDDDDDEVASQASTLTYISECTDSDSEARRVSDGVDRAHSANNLAADAWTFSPCSLDYTTSEISDVNSDAATPVKTSRVLLPRSSPKCHTQRTVSSERNYLSIDLTAPENTVQQHMYSPLTFNAPKGILKAKAPVKLSECLRDIVLSCVEEGLEDKSAAVHMLTSISTTMWRPKKKFVVYLFNLIWKATDLELFQELYVLLCCIHDLHGFSVKLDLWEILETAYFLDWKNDFGSEEEKLIQMNIKSAMFKFVCHVLESEITSGSFRAERILTQNECTSLKVWLEDTIKNYHQSNGEEREITFDILISLQRLLCLIYLTDLNEKVQDTLVSALCRIHERLDEDQRHVLISTIPLPRVNLKVHERLFLGVSSHPTDTAATCEKVQACWLGSPCSFKKIKEYYFRLDPKVVEAAENPSSSDASDAGEGKVFAVQRFLKYLFNLLEAYLKICKDNCHKSQHSLEDLPSAQDMQNHISQLQARLQEKFPTEMENPAVRHSILTLQLTLLHLEN